MIDSRGPPPLQLRAGTLSRVKRSKRAKVVNNVKKIQLSRSCKT